MAKFTPEQAADVLAVKQVIYEWGDELDINNGLKILDSGVLADDVRYFVGGEWREGKEAVGQFYQGRKEQLGDNAPVMRHIITSLRVSFTGSDHAKVGYLLVFFAKAGTPPFDGYCDPLAVADVKMECTRDASGEWRISLFDSGQIFRR
ncbi:nuclear transport factor 2 family protein [Novosphingobium sp. RD2P27]|uniref:Nuclear transport factor 2 family protein n=1 Tax=Novosphingobium kalidii TaxID=3230299 RepID=A0ABV2D173_9SPHN